MFADRLPEALEQHTLLFLPQSEIIRFREVNKHYSRMIPEWIVDQKKFCKIFEIKIEELQDLFRINFHKMPMKILAVCIEDYLLKAAIVQRMKVHFLSLASDPDKVFAKEAKYKLQKYQTLCCRKISVMPPIPKNWVGGKANEPIQTSFFYCRRCCDSLRNKTQLLNRGFTVTQLYSMPCWTISRDMPSKRMTTHVLCFPLKYVDIAAQLDQAAFCVKSVANSAEAGFGAGASRPLKKQKTQ